jgi:hypothetical protein
MVGFGGSFESLQIEEGKGILRRNGNAARTG